MKEDRLPICGALSQSPGKRSWRFLSMLMVAAGAGAAAWCSETNDLVSVTCELAYYAGSGSGEEWRLIPPNSDPTNLATVRGVVLKVVEPKDYTGKFVSFHFDSPPSIQNTCFYEPGLLYQGQIRTGYIGRLAFMCDPGLFIATKLARPLRPGTPKELGQVLLDRHWNDQYVAAIKEQFGDKVLFRVLYGFLTDTNHSNTRFADQQRAARLLLKHQPGCEVSLVTAMGETFGNCDEFVAEWPLYLWRCFGKEKLNRALDELEKSSPTEADREKIETWRYWLRWDEKELMGLPKQ